MEPHGAPESVNWEQMQWVFTTVLGGFSVVYGAILTYVFKELERLHSKDDYLAQLILQQNAANDDRFRANIEAVRDKLDRLASKEEISYLRQIVEDDRKVAARDRENIAVMMATKETVQTQFDRLSAKLLEAVGKRTTSSRGREE